MQVFIIGIGTDGTIRRLQDQIQVERHALGGSAVLAPITGTQVEVPSGYYIQPRYEITFTDSSGVLIDFAAIFNADDIASMKTGGVTITSGPTFDSVNVAIGYYEIHYTANTSSGPRYVIDKYYK